MQALRQQDKQSGLLGDILLSRVDGSRRHS